jgi:DNA-binding Lrp family transcriptional regulator
VAKPKTGAKLSVFKGREAKLNRAIFQALAIKGPQTIYDIHKQVRALRRFKYVRYASVNKRVKALEEKQYIKKAGIRKAKTGFQSNLYELMARAYLAMLLNSLDLEEIISQTNEATVLEVLAAITEHLSSDH